MTNGPAFLSRILYLDAATCAVMGITLTLGATPLSELLDLPTALLRAAGLLLLPFAALLASTARQSRPAAALVWGIVAANLAWVVASAAVLLGGVVQPNAPGFIFVVGQALAVAVIADLEAVALRRSQAASA